MAVWPYLRQVFSYFGGGGKPQKQPNYGRQQGPYGWICFLLKHLFQYTSRHEWNQLPASLHEPDNAQIHIFVRISTNLCLVYFLHPSLLHSKLKTYIFRKYKLLLLLLSKRHFGTCGKYRKLQETIKNLPKTHRKLNLLVNAENYLIDRDKWWTTKTHRKTDCVYRNLHKGVTWLRVVHANFWNTPSHAVFPLVYLCLV